MIDWKSHAIFALVLSFSWFAALYLLQLPITFVDMVSLVVLVLFASLFPDVDMRKSRIRGVVSLLTAVGIAFAYLLLYRETWYYAPVYFLVLFFLFRYLPTKHRGITHTYKFAVMFAAALSCLYMLVFSLSLNRLVLWFVILFTAYGLHLVLDRM